MLPPRTSHCRSTAHSPPPCSLVRRIANGKLAKRTGAAPRAIPTPDKLTFYVSDAVAADVSVAQRAKEALVALLP